MVLHPRKYLQSVKLNQKSFTAGKNLCASATARDDAAKDNDRSKISHMKFEHAHPRPPLSLHNGKGFSCPLDFIGTAK